MRDHALFVTGQNLSQKKYLCRRVLVVPLVASLLATSACQTTNQFISGLGVQSISADDVCGSYSTQLRESKGYFERNIVQGAVAGAIGGALLGALVGGDAKGALIGGAVGGLAGAAGGYLVSVQKESSDRSELQRTVYKDVQEEKAEIVRALTRFSRVRDCRLRQAGRIKSDFSAGLLTRAEAAQKLSDERKRYADDIIVVRAIGAKIDERHDEISEAVVYVAQGSSEAQSFLHQTEVAEAEAFERIKEIEGQPWRETAFQASSKMTATTNVNVRSKPDTSGKRLKLLEGGEVVDATGESSNGWTKVKLEDGRDGYVASDYLVESKADETDVFQAEDKELASLTRAVPKSADDQLKTVGAMFEGRSKRVELERLAVQAEHEEKTAFELDFG